MDIGEKFLSASKYRSLQRKEGAQVALSTLLADMGETRVVEISTPSHGSLISAAKIARVDAVGVTYSTATSKVNGIGPMVGCGQNDDEAMADLLAKLLEPEKQIPPDQNKDDARLLVLRPNQFKAKTLVKIGP